MGKYYHVRYMHDSCALSPLTTSKIINVHPLVFEAEANKEDNCNYTPVTIISWNEINTDDYQFTEAEISAINHKDSDDMICKRCRHWGKGNNNDKDISIGEALCNVSGNDTLTEDSCDKFKWWFIDQKRSNGCGDMMFASRKHVY